MACSWTDNLGNLWLFGGDLKGTTIYGYSRNDLWKYNVNTNNWTWMKGDGASTAISYSNFGIKGQPAADNTPGGRRAATTWTDKQGNLWLFGGLGNTTGPGGKLNDLWKYDISTNTWVWMSGEDTAGSPGFMA
jgi:N-acetylneuraminic acid mutarotase